MDEEKLKTVLKAAFSETEAVPADLEQSTIERGRAIEKGKQAEREIEAGRGNPQLISEAAAGRLLQMKKMPPGKSAEDISAFIRKQTSFKSFCEESPQSQLKSLRNGSFLSEITAQVQRKELSQESPPVVQAPGIVPKL